MTWPSSIFIAFLSGLLGLFCAGGIASLCVSWYRVSSFEGKSGYFVVLTALLGGLASVVIGLVAARIVAAGATPGFLKALGAGAGSVLGIALLALAICRLAADLAPEIDGKPVELAIEVRCPRDFNLPKAGEYGATAEVYLPRGRRLPSATLRVNDAQRVDGHLVVPATVPLTTSAGSKFLSVRFDKEQNLIFSLPLRSHPNAADREWSQWLESGWDAGKPQPPPAARFHARFRVMVVEPEPPPPDPNDVVAREFAELGPATLLSEWLPFLFRNPNAERTQAVVAQILARQDELAELVRSDDPTQREQALAAAKYVEKPASALVEAVLGEGRAIAAAIRHCNTLKPDDQEFVTALVELRSRFNDWKHAWWIMHRQIGADGRPPVRDIHELARTRARGTAMDEIEVNARAILEQLDQNAAEKQP
jgi:hypothetical protein